MTGYDRPSAAARDHRHRFPNWRRTRGIQTLSRISHIALPVSSNVTRTRHEGSISRDVSSQNENACSIILRYNGEDGTNLGTNTDISRDTKTVSIKIDREIAGNVARNTFSRPHLIGSMADIATIDRVEIWDRMRRTEGRNVDRYALSARDEKYHQRVFQR